MSQKDPFAEFLAKYKRLAQQSVNENRLIMNHLCIRVPDLTKAERLLAESFGIDNFIRLDADKDQMFPGEKALSVAWVAEGFYLELMEPAKKSDLGYDTGEGLPIGHLSEIGFFTPDMDFELVRLEKLGWKVTGECADVGGRMVKIDTDPPSGIPVELIQILDSETE